MDSPSKWTVETLREHFLAIMTEAEKRNEQRFLAQEKAVTLQLAASEKAVAVAESNAEKWRSNANEWRGAMNDRERSFASREDLQAIKERLDRWDGKATGANAMWGYLIGAIGLAAAIAAIITSIQ